MHLKYWKDIPCSLLFCLSILFKIICCFIADLQSSLNSFVDFFFGISFISINFWSPFVAFSDFSLISDFFWLLEPLLEVIWMRLKIAWRQEPDGGLCCGWLLSQTFFWCKSSVEETFSFVWDPTFINMFNKGFLFEGFWWTAKDSLRLQTLSSESLCRSLISESVLLRGLWCISSDKSSTGADFCE